MKVIWIKKDASEFIEMRYASFAINNLRRPFAPSSITFIDLRDFQLWAQFY